MLLPLTSSPPSSPPIVSPALPVEPSQPGPTPQTMPATVALGSPSVTPSSREYTGIKQVIDRLPDTPISASTVLRYAKNFPTLARAFEGLPATAQFSKADLNEILATLEKLDTNRDLKISRSEAAAMAEAFPELNEAFESGRIPANAQVAASAVLKQMLIH
jgi:hypothetical protein